MRIIAGASYSQEVLELKSSRPCWTIQYTGKQNPGEHAVHIVDAAGTDMWFIYNHDRGGQRYYKCVYIR